MFIKKNIQRHLHESGKHQLNKTQRANRQ